MKTFTLVRLTVKITCNRRGLTEKQIVALSARLHKATLRNSLTRDVSVSCGDIVTHYALSDKGYGRISFNGKNAGAHRVSWFLKYGSFPAALVLHRCDNPPCVNPAHLFAGTYLDNQLDMIAKGRQVKNPRRGERNPLSKLTNENVFFIRSSSLNCAELGRMFKISKVGVWRIKKRQIWTHI